MSINDLSFCDHGYTEIKICPSCLREKDDQIASLKSLLKSAHEIIFIQHQETRGNNHCACAFNTTCSSGIWLSSYSQAMKMKGKV